jgi:hypothetical protein
MRFSWGNRILVAILLFIGGMGYLVYRSVNTNYDLVSQEYYKDELEYQKVIDASERAGQLSQKASVSVNDSGILIQLPEEMKGKILKGSVYFYCPTDVKKDRKTALAVNEEARQSIGLDQVPPGNYTVKIQWESGNQSYYSEQSLTR